MRVIRDYIPETENPTPEEEARFANAKAFVKGGVKQDFVPGKGHKLRKPAPNGSERALAKALRDAEKAVATEFAAAKRRLAQLNIAEAVALMLDLPVSVQEMYYVAEQSTGNRKDVLDQFPEPSDEVKETYLASE